MTEKTSGFGIGEAGKTPATTVEDEIEAERLQASVRPGAVMVRCPHCGQMYSERLGMTSAHDTVCPDCYDDCED